MKFEDLKLGFGFPIQLQTADAEPKRYACRLIGCVQDNTLIVSYPRTRNKAAKVRTGQKVVVRVMAGNGISLFATSIEHIISTPFPMLHLAYPSKVNFKKIRGATRVDTYLPVSVANESALDQSLTEGVISDISISGCKLALTDAIANVGDRIEIRAEVMIGSMSRELCVNGVVRARIERSTKENDADLSAVYGVEYTEADEDRLLVLHAFVYREMAESNMPSAEK